MEPGRAWRLESRGLFKAEALSAVAPFSLSREKGWRPFR
jgi:hypothetical protein